MTVKPAMEQFIMRHIIPELTSQEHFLRAIVRPFYLFIYALS